ncbi:nickel insertion protein [Amycolatopsis sp.]|jgi:hypothetical protein|uniref:nickel insertion protein n=1 Tax=Amycolatopsis sp. TaxID=37632 RepID=UPI002DF978EF|nr:nickel insertion protein [Amycolatopsis sp.]
MDGTPNRCVSVISLHRALRHRHREPAGSQRFRGHRTASPETEHAHHLADIVELIEAAALAQPVERFAIAVFNRLADAEAAVHGIERTRVYFPRSRRTGRHRRRGGRRHGHSGVRQVAGSPPAVLALLTGAAAPIAAHPAARELCTATGAALLVALADRYGPMPACAPVKVGVGAGTADPSSHANVVRAAAWVRGS